MCRQIFLAKQPGDDCERHDDRFSELQGLIERHRVLRESAANTSEQEFEVMEDTDT